MKAKAKIEEEKAEEEAKAQPNSEILGKLIKIEDQISKNHEETLDKMEQNQEMLLKSFDKQSRLIVKATSDVAPRYMLLLPLAEVAPNSEEDAFSRIKSFGKLAMDGLEGLVRKRAELWFLCEGPSAGIESTCSEREPIIIDRYNDWIVQTAPYLKYIALALSIAAKLGTGLNVLNSAAGVDCEALNALTRL